MSETAAVLLKPRPPVIRPLNGVKPEKVVRDIVGWQYDLLDLRERLESPQGDLNPGAYNIQIDKLEAKIRDRIFRCFHTKHLPGHRYPDPTDYKACRIVMKTFLEHRENRWLLDFLYRAYPEASSLPRFRPPHNGLEMWWSGLPEAEHWYPFSPDFAIA